MDLAISLYVVKKLTHNFEIPNRLPHRKVRDGSVEFDALDFSKIFEVEASQGIHID